MNPSQLLAVTNRMYPLIADDELAQANSINSRVPILWPLYHSVQNAHVTVHVSNTGDFEKAETVIADDTATIIPVTWESVKRAGPGKSQTDEDGVETCSLPPHPLNDCTRVVAGDYTGADSSFSKYLALLQAWADLDVSNDKLRAVLTYVQKRSLLADLQRAGINVSGFKNTPPHKVFIRFSVTQTGICDRTWDDGALRNSWVSYQRSLPAAQGLCMITGQRMALAKFHPRRVLNSGSNARLISSNDTFGLGLTTTGQRTCIIGEETTQQAHSVLRWLIARQGHRVNDAVVLVFTPGTDTSAPNPMADTDELLAETSTPDDYGLSMARRLKQWLDVWRGKWAKNRLDREGVIITVMEATCPGRISLSHCQELSRSEYLERVYSWHTDHAWFQYDHVGAPSPRDIIKTAYGDHVNDKQYRLAAQRILDCIINNRPLPSDLVKKCVRQVARQRQNREKLLPVACAVVRGALTRIRKGEYPMALDENNVSRDYLWGRLWAIADNIESAAMQGRDANRPTGASNLWASFEQRPCSVWRIIRRRLKPYENRLCTSAKPWQRGLLAKRTQLIRQITDQIAAGASDQPLGKEWIQGYDLQQRALYQSGGTTNNQEEEEQDNE